VLVLYLRLSVLPYSHHSHVLKSIILRLNCHCWLLLSIQLSLLPPGAFAGGAKLGPKEQAYVSVVKQLSSAAAAAAAGGSAPQPDPIAAFGAACEQYEDKSPDTLMSSCWKLLGDILSIAQGKGATPSQNTDYVEMLLQVR
jgi:hypothetical protein